MSPWFAIPKFLGFKGKDWANEGLKKAFLTHGPVLTSLGCIVGIAWTVAILLIPKAPESEPEPTVSELNREHDLTNVYTLFGVLPPALPTTARLPSYVFSPVQLKGILWTGRSDTSYVMIEYDGSLLLRREGTGLDDGSLITEIGVDYVTLARGPGVARVALDGSNLGTNANPWAGAVARLQEAHLGAPPPMPLAASTVDKAWSTAEIHAFAHASRRDPPPARTVRRRDNVSATADPRLQAIRMALEEESRR